MSWTPYATAGAELRVGTSPTFTKVDGVQGWDGPGGDKPEIDLTPIDADAAVKVTGIPDWGSMTVTIAFDPANTEHGTIRTACLTPNSTLDVQIAYPDVGAATETWTGCQFKNWRGSFQKNAGMLFTFDIVMNGASTLSL